MPHACAPPNASAAGNVVVGSAAAPPQGVTHICENATDKVSYCGEPVSIVDPSQSDCHPTKYGPTCGGCQSECHRRHPNLPH